jgi:preprotein translocase subunit SecD
MKKISYSIIAIFILSIIAMGFTHKVNTSKCRLLQTVENNVSQYSLSESAQIISARLHDFSTENFDMTIINEKNQIKVCFSEKWDMNFVDSLLVNKGGMEFYETYERQGLSELLNGNHQLTSLFNASDTAGKIGCTTIAETGKVNKYIKTLDPAGCRFAWGRNFNDTNVCLYALKTSGVKPALINGSDIESVKFNADKTSKSNEIEITLKESAVKLWAEATKRNINKAIAIVLNDQVIAAPIVRSEINGGHCMITGNFTETEAKYIAALANNGEPPVCFKIVK